MKTTWPTLWLLGLLIAAGCSVIPAEVEKKALPHMDFQVLIREAGHHKGRTVILGGYVLAVENQQDHTRIVAVQAPLRNNQEPRSKDLSQGRLVLIYPGFLDPEVYTAGRKITVGGTLLGSSSADPDPDPFPYVRVEVEELHLWPAEQPLQRDYYHYPYWGWGHPYPWGWRHPYWW